MHGCGLNIETFLFLDSVSYCFRAILCKFFTIIWQAVQLLWMPAKDTSLLPVSEICLKVLTLVLLLILSKTSVFIAYYSISFYIVLSVFTVFGI